MTITKLHFSAALSQGLALGLSVAALLGGCTAQVRVASPPPPAVYVAPPPPPPVYVAPAVEMDVQAYEAPPPLPV